MKVARFIAAVIATASVSVLLRRTQLEDGSWHVRSRSVKFQPSFESGFPHEHDQWISAAATVWAGLGLSVTIAR